MCKLRLTDFNFLNTENGTRFQYQKSNQTNYQSEKYFFHFILVYFGFAKKLRQSFFFIRLRCFRQAGMFQLHLKSNFYKDLATPIFNSPRCGFVRVQRILIFVARIAILRIKGAEHRNIICKEIERIAAKTLRVEKLNMIMLNLHIMS